MCSNKNLFKTINFKYKADVFMADGQKIPTTGIGDIFLQCTKHDGTNHMAKLCDVLYVPRLCGNLISVKKLVEKGLEVHFKGKLCRIITLIGSKWVYKVKMDEKGNVTRYIAR